jgi:hypothetical protein
MRKRTPAVDWSLAPYPVPWVLIRANTDASQKSNSAEYVSGD